MQCVLKLTKEGSKDRIYLSDQGSLKYNGKILKNQGEITGTSHMLALIKDGEIKIGFNNRELHVKAEVYENLDNNPISGNFGFFNKPHENPNPPMMVGSDGTTNDNLLIKGDAIDVEVPISTVAYVDGEGVFDRTWGSEFQFAHANIDGEGRRDYSEGSEKNYYYVKDYLGSTRMVINEDCEMVESYAYTAYGVMKDLYVSGNSSTRERFTTKEFDTEGQVDGVVDGIGLNYFGRRYYDPEIGRFISPDPAEQYVDGYSYCDGDPINKKDEDGLAASGINPNFLLDFGQRLVSNALEGSALPAIMQNAILANATNSLSSMFNVGMSLLDKFHLALGVAGMAPGIGFWGDLASGVVSLGRSGWGFLTGNFGDAYTHLAGAGVDGLAMLPGVGIGARAADLTATGIKAGSKAAGAAKGGNYVYRGLAKTDDITIGLMARAPNAGNSPISHVAGKRASQWISSTKDPLIALKKWGENGVVRIDLDKVYSTIIDVSKGFPNKPGMISNWAIKHKEVLIKNIIPVDAIKIYP